MRAARRAGDLIVRSLSRLDSIKIDTKGRNDFVTDIDRKAEADIIATIRRSHPQHAVLGDEPGQLMSLVGMFVQNLAGPTD